MLAHPLSLQVPPILSLKDHTTSQLFMCSWLFS